MSKRPNNIRSENPSTVWLQENDIRILETIHAFDGRMSFRQLYQLFFDGKAERWARERLRALFENGYLTMPDDEWIHKVPIGETVYFLDEKGLEEVANLYGEITPTFPWKHKPRVQLIPHDLKLNDFRIAVKKATDIYTQFTLQEWVPEGEFWAYPDKVTYYTDSGRPRSRTVRPDGFFTIRRPSRNHPDKVEQLAFLLEIDMVTEQNPRFVRDKVLPGKAYIRSKTYKKRFGVNYGCFLVVTKSKRHLVNLKAATERAGGSGHFYFTTFDWVNERTVLTEPIWRLAGSQKLFSIQEMPLSPLEAGVLYEPTTSRGFQTSFIQ